MATVWVIFIILLVCGLLTKVPNTSDHRRKKNWNSYASSFDTDSSFYNAHHITHHDSSDNYTNHFSADDCCGHGSLGHDSCSDSSCDSSCDCD